MKMLYRFLLPQKNGECHFAHHLRNRWIIRRLLSVHRFLFAAWMKKNIFVENLPQLRPQKGLVLVTFHTESAWENVCEIMDLLNCSQLAIVMTKNDGGPQILQSFINRFQGQPLKDTTNVYYSHQKDFNGKKFHILFTDDKVKYVAQMSRLIEQNVPILLAYDGAQQQNEDGYCFSYQGRPLIHPHPFLAKVVAKYALQVIAFFAHRDQWGKDFLVFHRLKYPDNSTSFASLFYQELYTFMVDQGKRFETSWQGFHFIGSNLAALWKGTPSPFVTTSVPDDYLVLHQEVLCVAFPKKLKQKGGVLILPFPYTRIKIGPKTFRALKKSSFLAKELPAKLAQELWQRKMICQKKFCWADGSII